MGAVAGLVVWLCPHRAGNRRAYLVASSGARVICVTGARYGWWQGTLQALGVGLIVGGLVDVLAISGLNRVLEQRARINARINDIFRAMLESADRYPDRGAYEEALDFFVAERWSQVQYLDPDVHEALDASGAPARLWNIGPAIRRPSGHVEPPQDSRPGAGAP